MLEVVDKEKLGVRLSPYFNINGIADAEPEQMALYLADEFNKRGIAYLSIAEPSWVGGISLTDTFKKKIREAFSGVLIYAGEYTPEKAEEAVRSGDWRMPLVSDVCISPIPIWSSVSDGGTLQCA